MLRVETLPDNSNRPVLPSSQIIRVILIFLPILLLSVQNLQVPKAVDALNGKGVSFFIY